MRTWVYRLMSSGSDKQVSFGRVRWPPMLSSLVVRSLGLESTEKFWEGLSSTRALFFSRPAPHETLLMADRAITTMALDSIEERFLVVGDARGDIQIFDTCPPVAAAPRPSAGAGPSFVSRQTRKLKGGAECVRSAKKRTHKAAITALGWYPIDSGAFVSGSADGSVVVWDSQRFEPVETVLPFADEEDGPGRIRDIALPPVGITHALVAVAGSDKRAVLYDMTSGASSHSLSGHMDEVTAVAWDPSNEWVCVTGSLDKSIRLWDVRRSGAAACFGQFDPKHAKMGRSGTDISAGISPASAAAAGGGGRLKVKIPVVDAANEALERAPSVHAHGGGILCIHFVKGTSGRVLASLGADHRMTLWDTQRQTSKWVNFKKVVSGGAGTAALSSMPCGPNNQFLLFHPSNSKSLTVYEGSTGAVAVKLDAHFEAVTCCATSPAKQAVFSGGADGAVLRWRPNFPARLPLDVPVRSVPSAGPPAANPDSTIGLEWDST